MENMNIIYKENIMKGNGFKEKDMAEDNIFIHQETNMMDNGKEDKNGEEVLQNLLLEHAMMDYGLKIR